MTETTSRNPLLATVASMIMPGLGQLYTGQATKGLLLFLGLGATTPVSAWLALRGPDSAMWVVMVVFLILSLSVYAYAVVDAYRSARRIGDSYMPKEFNQPYIYILVFIIGYFFIFSGLFNYTRERLVESFYIPSQSMLPTVLQGDFLFADKRVNCLGCKIRLKRGDLAILVSPNNRTALYIKRIIGLPGDNIEIAGTDIKVNGVSIRGAQVTDFEHTELKPLLATHTAWRERSDKDEYTVIWQNDASQQDASFTVPNGQVYVLGDNRNAAQDSRFFGTVPLVDVIGKAKQVWFSKSPGSGIRWGRIGSIVDANR
ncbi:MAG: signal peptidase I [Gammaproteobacteria bacterium]|nr:signal peptidase I [Gammaproteobacteria bacterium]